MHIEIFSFTDPKKTFIKEGEEIYLERLRTLHPVALKNLRKRGSVPTTVGQLKEWEANRFREECPERAYTILLDEKGKSLTSKGFASLIEKQMNNGVQHLVFGIGGTYGWSDEIKKEANQLLSLSPMTFTAQFARLVLIEQIYRAHTLLRGIPYHNE